MKITVRQSNTRAVRPGDKLWHIVDGPTMTPRAGFEIASGCPHSYAMIITECLERGWLKPVAHMTTQEQVAELLTNG